MQRRTFLKATGIVVLSNPVLASIHKPQQSIGNLKKIGFYEIEVQEKYILDKINQETDRMKKIKHFNFFMNEHFKKIEKYDKPVKSIYVSSKMIEMFKKIHKLCVDVDVDSIMSYSEKLDCFKLWTANVVLKKDIGENIIFSAYLNEDSDRKWTIESFRKLIKMSDGDFLCEQMERSSEVKELFYKKENAWLILSINKADTKTAMTRSKILEDMRKNPEINEEEIIKRHISI